MRKTKLYKILTLFVFVGVVVALFPSCAQMRPQINSIENSKESSTEFVYKYVHDTVMLRDSSVVRTVGDTVFAEKWHVKYISKNIHDTLILKDTVFLTKIKTKEIKAPEPTFKEKIGSFVLTFGFIVIFCLIIYILKKYMLWK